MSLAKKIKAKSVARKQEALKVRYSQLDIQSP